MIHNKNLKLLPAQTTHLRNVVTLSHQLEQDRHRNMATIQIRTLTGKEPKLRTRQYCDVYMTPSQKNQQLISRLLRNTALHGVGNYVVR